MQATRQHLVARASLAEPANVALAAGSQQHHCDIDWDRVFTEDVRQTASNGDGTLRTYTLAGGQTLQGLDIMYAASLAAAETVMQALHDNIKGNSLMGFDLEWVSSAVNREVKATRPSLALH
jgi:uncharacterized protein YhjY with autotransporter beta-barrel domain